MRVLLYESVEGLGNTGDIVEVADGYARNSLIPRRVATKATDGAVAQAERMRKAWQDKNAEEVSAATEIAERLADISLEMPAKTSQEGKLFGSIGAREIADALSLESGVDFDRKTVQLDEPIKALGETAVTVSTHPEVSFEIKVSVVEG